jgi:serine/threonine protein phosphatase PrpC
MSFRFATAAATPRTDGTTEDRVAVHQLQEAMVIVVADGAGGIPGGDVAADAVVRGIPDAIADEPEKVEGLVERLRRFDDEIEGMPMVARLCRAWGARRTPWSSGAPGS